jgi:3-hydroxybutyryl-CoA dehydrogenase
MTRAAVIGAGTMGNGIAHVFAQHGWEVALVDSAPAALEKASATIRSNLERQVKKGVIPAGAPGEVLARLKTVGSLEGAAHADLVVEAASEDPAVKF